MSLFFLFACTTGTNYPDQYAEGFCDSLFLCVNPDEIDLNYDSKEECIEDIAKTARSGSQFEQFEEGDLVFDKENAETCLTEVVEIQNDSDCDGSMNFIAFGIDSYDESCANIYVEAE